MGKLFASHRLLVVRSLAALVTFGAIPVFESSTTQSPMAYAQSDEGRREYFAGAARKDKLVIDIPFEAYLQHRAEIRDSSSQFNLNKFVDADYDIIQHIATLLRGLDKPDGAEFSVSTRGMEIPDYQRVFEFVAANVTYTADVGQGYTKYPLETLIDQAGDCEDKAVLGAALLRSMGRRVVWIYEPNHVTLGVGLHEREELPSFFTTGPPVRSITPAAFEWEQSRYFAVEITAPYWHKFKEQITPEPGRGIVTVK